MIIARKDDKSMKRESFLGSVRVYEGGTTSLIYGYWENFGSWWRCNGVWYRDDDCELLYK